MVCTAASLIFGITGISCRILHQRVAGIGHFLAAHPVVLFFVAVSLPVSFSWRALSGVFRTSNLVWPFAILLFMVEAYHDNRYAGFVFESLTELHEQFAGMIEIVLLTQTSWHRTEAIRRHLPLWRRRKHHHEYGCRTGCDALRPQPIPYTSRHLHAM